MDFYVAEAFGPYGLAAHTAVNNFTTKQNVSQLGYVPVLLGGRSRVGTKLSLRARGNFSTTGTPTLSLGFWFGTRALSMTGDIAISSAITTGSGAAAWPWMMEWDGVCTKADVSGTYLGMGRLYLGTALTTFAAPVPIPITQALRTITIDTTIERAFGVSAAFSAASVSNQVQVDDITGFVWN